MGKKYTEEFHISNLISAYSRAELNADQEQELQEWIERSESNRELFSSLTDEAKLQPKLRTYLKGNVNNVWHKTLALVHSEQLPDEEYILTEKPRRFYLWTRFAVVAASAAAIILVVWTWNGNNTAKQVPATSSLVNDVEPGGNRATLTLANGKKISLSAAKTGLVVGNGRLVYNDGSALKSSGDVTTSILQDNNIKVQTLIASTPAGGTYYFVLPDGTHVWLNAASTLKFPASFSKSNTRNVELSGEGYFIVAKDKAHPFIVHTDQQELKVLGTHFNISSYPDDQSTTTTLLEGSVKLSTISAKQDRQRILEPGQQARLSSGNFRVSAADTEAAIAWKDGKIIFQSESVENIMRKVARWYDVDVKYEGNFSDLEFGGSISIHKKISSVLEFFSKTKDLSYKIEGRIVTLTRKEPNKKGGD